MDFEATNSFCYQFARYVALPEILQMPQVQGGAEFRLIELSREVIARHLTDEQQSATFIRPQAGVSAQVGQTIRFYIPFVAKNTKQLISLGGGLFRLPTADDISEDALEASVADVENDSDPTDPTIDQAGTVYAFTFPMLKRNGAPFPIKVGRATGSPEARIAVQCRQSAAFESPEILRLWSTQRVQALERAIHSVLRCRGKWREHAPGKEWFDTTLDEIEEIVQFIERR
ncbi:GIY-YIG nuclease family protein [Bordetella petrii]|uniref:GIY-YIG nuclease family protein n=1 Tax=Bordetella petrii TaxID=94624 RepID=UPI003733FB74